MTCFDRQSTGEKEDYSNKRSHTYGENTYEQPKMFGLLTRIPFQTLILTG